MGTFLALCARANLTVRRRGPGAVWKRLRTGSWPTFTGPYMATVMIELPLGERVPTPSLYVDERGRPAVRVNSDAAIVKACTIKELSL